MCALHNPHSKVPDGHDTRTVAVSGPDASGHVWLATAGFDRRLRLWRRREGGRQGDGRSAWECVHTIEVGGLGCKVDCRTPVYAYASSMTHVLEW